MTQTEKDEKIQRLEEELRELKATPPEPKRFRAIHGGEYSYINFAGDVAIDIDARHNIDNARHDNGNYWKPYSKDAENSTLYFVIRSEYEYWLPGSDMKNPKDVPEGLQCYHDDDWHDSTTSPGYWEYNVYRWPKSSYKG
jgi:hypothetical protein